MTSAPKSASNSDAYGPRHDGGEVDHPHTLERARRDGCFGRGRHLERVASPPVGGELVELRLELGVERGIERGDVVGELLRPARPDDRRGDRRLRQHPRHREGGHRHAGVGRDRPQRVDGVELTVVPVARLVHRARGAEHEARAVGRRRLPIVLSGEQPTRERVVRDHADPLFLAQREQLPLDLAEQQVVARLHRLEAHEVARLAPPDRARQPVREEVRAPDVARLPGPDDGVEGLERLVDRRVGIREVQLVEVDVVGAEPAQRRVDRVEDVLARVALVPRVGTGAPVALRRDDELVALPAQPPADDLLGAADGVETASERVDVGAVEERDPGVGGGVEDRPRRVLVALEPERHRAETEARDLEAGAAEAYVLHGAPIYARDSGDSGPDPRVTMTVVLVTGGNAGIGLETCVGLAAQGRHVVLTSRSAARGDAARAEIVRRSANETVDVMTLDLASFASVREFASSFLDRYDEIGVVVHNAGVVLSSRQVTEDGNEMTFQVNHLGPFLLDALLRDRVIASGDARVVVVVSSDAHTSARHGLDFDDLQTERQRYQRVRGVRPHQARQHPVHTRARSSPRGHRRHRECAASRLRRDALRARRRHRDARHRS